MPHSEDKGAIVDCALAAECDDFDLGRRHTGSRPDMLDQFHQHIAEEHANRAIMIEMRDSLHRLGEMHHGITADEHQTLFDWWREHVAASKVRAERWEKVRQTAIGYAVVALIGSIVTLGQPVGRAVLEHWHDFLNRLK